MLQHSPQGLQIGILTKKGANILVDNRVCIKLADFGASKKVVKLGTISGMKEPFPRYSLQDASTKC